MTIYGILPMAGKGSRLQPIGFSKELYPVVYKNRHFAISEFSVIGMLKAKAIEVKLIINPEKLDIAKYYAQSKYPISAYFYNSPSLPDSCLHVIDRLDDEDICLFGLSDTLYSPSNAYVKIKKSLERGSDITLGLFQVNDGSLYDSVSMNEKDEITGVLVKQSPPLSNWIWGIWGGKVHALRKLKKIIDSQDVVGEKLLGVGFNTLCKSKKVSINGVKLSKKYFDIGTMEAIVKANSVIQNFGM